MSTSDNNNSYLARIIIIAACILLLLVWIGLYEWKWDESTTWNDLGKSVVPELLGPLVAFIIVYFLFIRRNIDIEALAKGQQTDWLKEGYENFDDIDWNPVLKSSKKIVIAAYFFEEWINEYTNSMTHFFSKTDTRLIVFLPDFRNEDVLNKIHAIIPEHSQKELSNKIQNSISEIKRRSIEKHNDVSIWLYNDAFNYTFQMFDKTMYLSVNQFHREEKFKSPFIVLNLKYSKKLNTFYNKEQRALEKKSTSLNLNKWTV